MLFVRHFSCTIFCCLTIFIRILNVVFKRFMFLVDHFSCCQTVISFVDFAIVVR